MNKRYSFIKRRESLPVIEMGEIVEPKAGGIKLEYEVYATDNIRLRIGDRDIYIPYWKYQSMRLTFIKILKEYWDSENNPLAPNFWNKKDSIYTNLWVILESKKGNLDCFDDVNNIELDYRDLRIKTQCTKREHHRIITHLLEKADYFSIPFTQIFF